MLAGVDYVHANNRMLMIWKTNVHRVNILVLKKLLVIVINLYLPIARKAAILFRSLFIISSYCSWPSVSAIAIQVAHGNDPGARVSCNFRHVMDGGNATAANRGNINQIARRILT